MDPTWKWDLPEPGSKLLETLWKIGVNCLTHLDNSVSLETGRSTVQMHVAVQVP